MYTLKVPIDAADDMVLEVLEDHHKMIKVSLDKFYDGQEWLHRADVEDYILRKKALETVIDYFGGSVE